MKPGLSSRIDNGAYKRRTTMMASVTGEEAKGRAMRTFFWGLGIFVCITGLLIGGCAAYTGESMYAMFTLAYLALGVSIVEYAA